MADRSAWKLDPRSLGGAFWTFLPVLYVVSAIPIIVFLAFFRQPIGVADEWSHIARAAQLADGHLFTQVAEAGKPPLGSIDPSFKALTNTVHARRHEIAATLLPALQAFRWSDERTLANYNSAVYFPAPYLLSIISIKIGQASGAGIVETLQIANILNGLLCVVLAALAIAVSPHGKALIFIVAMLPMSLFLFASASPDGPLISSGLLVFAFLMRSFFRERSSIADFTVVTLLSIVIVATKLPYLPLFLAATAAMWLGSSSWNRPSWVVPLAAAIMVVAVSVGWSVITKAGSIDVTWGRATGNPSAQAAFLLQHPDATILLGWRTLSAYGLSYLHQMVGYLGWQDAPISTAGEYLLLGVVLLALLLDGPLNRFGTSQFLILLGLVASFGAVFLSLYVAANPVGSMMPIEGVQGRYFLPLLAFVAVVVPAVRRNLWTRGILGAVLVASIPVAGFETMRTVIERYYV